VESYRSVLRSNFEEAPDSFLGKLRQESAFDSHRFEALARSLDEAAEGQAQGRGLDQDLAQWVFHVVVESQALILAVLSEEGATGRLAGVSGETLRKELARLTEAGDRFFSARVEPDEVEASDDGEGRVVLRRYAESADAAIAAFEAFLKEGGDRQAVVTKARDLIRVYDLHRAGLHGKDRDVFEAHAARRRAHLQLLLHKLELRDG
jgi:hypothetical protein